MTIIVADPKTKQLLVDDYIIERDDSLKEHGVEKCRIVYEPKYRFNAERTICSVFDYRDTETIQPLIENFLIRLERKALEKDEKLVFPKKYSGEIINGYFVTRKAIYRLCKRNDDKVVIRILEERMDNIDTQTARMSELLGVSAMDHILILNHSGYCGSSSISVIKQSDLNPLPKVTKSKAVKKENKK